MSARKTVWSYQDSSLGQSFLWSLAVTALPVATGFVVSWVVARWAGPAVIGTVSWVMSFATMLEIPGKFGMDLSVSQMASEYGVKAPGRLRSLFRTAVGLRLVFTVGVSILTLFFAPSIARFFKDPGLTLPVRIGAGVLFCASLYEFQENFLIGLNRLRAVYKIRSLHLSLRVAATCAFVAAGASAVGILSGYCAAWIVAIAIFAVLLRRFLPAADPSPPPDGQTRRLMRLSLALTVSSASVILYSHMDRLILGYFSGVSEVGQYTVARNIAEVSLFPVFAAMMMLRPALAGRYSAGKVPECARVIRRTLRYTFVSGVWFCAVFVTLGVPLVTLVFSESFRYSGRLLVWFVGVIAFRSVGAVILPALVAAGRARLYAYLTLSSAAIYFGTSVLLIPRFESRGAIVATFVSYGVLMAVGIREVFRIYGVRLGWRPLSVPIRTILAGAAASGLTWWLTEHTPVTLHVLAGAALVTVIYLFLILVLRVGTLSDLRSLRSNLRESNK
jgi:O-antigen/teichoic acid export membrane protein